MFHLAKQKDPGLLLGLFACLSGFSRRRVHHPMRLHWDSNHILPGTMGLSSVKLAAGAKLPEEVDERFFIYDVVGFDEEPQLVDSQ
jgi:hypothetical protein